MKSCSIPIVFKCLPILALFVAVLCGCDKETSPTDNTSSSQSNTVSIPLEGTHSDIKIMANQKVRKVFTFHMLPDVGVIEGIKIDVKATLDKAKISSGLNKKTGLQKLQRLLSEQQVKVFFRFGTDPATVCEEGEEFGPKTATFSYLNSPKAGEIDLPKSAIKILNGGFIVICTDLISSFDVTLNIDKIETKIRENECGAPQKFHGYWKGVYRCDQTVDGRYEGSFGDSITIRMTQDGDEAAYTNLKDENYTGRICGDIYKFERSGNKESERGTMALVGEDRAVKRSTYQSKSGENSFSGNCVDSLVRVDEKK
jgi:hypothetical protein